jgi:hypothetical protein
MPGPIASRYFADHEMNAIINALDGNKDKVIGRNELNITDSYRFQRMDTNDDGRLQAYEAKDGLKMGLIKPIRFNNRDAAIPVLLKFDGNQDGYLDKNEFQLESAAVRKLDGYGSNKYAYASGELVYDDKNRVRETGAARADGRVSIAELANALGDRQFAMGDALYFHDGSF